MYFLLSISGLFLIIAIIFLLFLIVYLIGLIFTDKDESEMVDFWCDGITFFFFSALVTFSLGILFRAISLI